MEPIAEYREYRLETYMLPYWQGKTMYNETCMFVKNQDGSLDPAPLLFRPVRILDVRSFDLKQIYREGVDYTVEGAFIRLLPGSGIPVWDFDEYYPEQYVEGKSFPCTNGRNIKYAEGSTFISKQIAVTYEYSEKWEGLIPPGQAGRFSRTLDKLKNKQPLTVLLNGDSVGVGCNASGWSEIRYPPYMPIFSQMVVDVLKKIYSYEEISLINTAVGGTVSKWGLENAEENINRYNPDLVILVFGGNDGAGGTPVTPDAFVENIHGIIDKVREKNPETEFILVSPELPNAEACYFNVNHILYEAPMNRLANSLPGVATAPVTSVFEYVMKKKSWRDFAGNNINHPNDFMLRIYAQTICKTLIGEDPVL